MWVLFIGIMGAYAAMHVYLFFKVRAAFPGATRLGIALAAFLGLMVVAPFLIHRFEHAEHVVAARTLGLVGYTWVAWVFWFASFALAADSWNLLAPRFRIPQRRLVLGAVAAILVATVWGVVEASRIRVAKVFIEMPGLPPGAKPIRLVQVSDLHLGIDRGPGVLRRVIGRIRELAPDALVSTGDLVDASYEHLRPLAEELRRLDLPLGKFAVLGNHEYYTGLDESIAFHEAAGFRLLRGATLGITPQLRLAGVDDPAGHYTGQPSFDDESPLPPTRPEQITILLKHQPLLSTNAAGRFDLQLSGHIHGGQIFPFQFPLRFMYPYPAGLHRLAGESWMFISRGAGTWGPPLRLLAPPDICLVTLTPTR